MAKRVSQPAYAVTVGHFLGVLQAYLAIWRRSIPTQGVRHRPVWVCDSSAAGRPHSVRQFQTGGQHVAQ